MVQKSLKKNTVFNAIKTFSSIIFPLITFPYISRTLLAENVGKIHFGLSIISYFTLIASLGITTYAIRECAAVRDDRNKLSQVSSQIFSINIITTAVAYLLLALTLIFYSKSENYKLLITIQSLSIIFTTLGTDWINSAMEDFKYITIRTLSFQVISLVLMFVFVRKPEDYLLYAVICLISSSGANILNIWYRKKYCDIRFTLKIDWKKHLSPIILLFVMILAQNVFANVDTTMLGLIHGDREVGIYSTAHKINSIVSQVVTSVLWVIMPRMSLYFAKKDYPAINSLLRKLLGLNCLIGFPCAVGIILMSKDIILIIGGNEFADAAPVLQLRIVSFIISLFGGNLLGNAILLPSKKEKYYMVVCCITAVINIITNYIFIPMYGAMAAAGTTAFCSLCIMVMLLFKVDKHIKLTKLTNLIVTPLIGCIFIVVVCLGFSFVNNIFIRALSSVILSVLIYVAVEIIIKNELAVDLIKSVFGRLKNKKEKKS